MGIILDDDGVYRQTDENEKILNGCCKHWDGSFRWYKDGLIHREDGPAIEYEDGTKEWYLNGKLGREDGPAVEGIDGTLSWYKNGKRHREDGPAFIYKDGGKKWFKNGREHREDGPAIEGPNGYKRWYIEGKNVTEQEFEKFFEVVNLKKQVAEMTAEIKKLNEKFRNFSGHTDNSTKLNK